MLGGWVLVLMLSIDLVLGCRPAVPLERFVTGTNTQTHGGTTGPRAAAGRIFTSEIYPRGLHESTTTETRLGSNAQGQGESDLDPRLAVLLAFGPARREGGETETETNNRTKERETRTGKGNLHDEAVGYEEASEGDALFVHILRLSRIRGIPSGRRGASSCPIVLSRIKLRSLDTSPFGNQTTLIPG